MEQFQDSKKFENEHLDVFMSWLNQRDDRQASFEEIEIEFRAKHPMFSDDLKNMIWYGVINARKLNLLSGGIVRSLEGRLEVDDDFTDTQPAGLEAVSHESDVDSNSIPEMLAELTIAIADEREKKAEFTRLGHVARARGATYRMLAEATGLSVQAAHQRWSEDGNKKHRDRQRERTHRDS